MDHIIGGGLGFAMGLIMVALLCWTYQMFQVGVFAKNLSDISGSLAARASSVLIDRGPYFAVKRRVKMRRVRKNFQR